MKRHAKHPAVVLAAYTLLAIALTWPLITNLTRAVPSDIGDPLLNSWILAWVTHALLTEPLNLFNANIFYPLPNTLAYSEHLFSTALPALPLQLITTEPVATYNLSLLLSFPLAAFGMYLLALHWSRDRGAAFVTGLIFGFAPYRFAAIAHLQLLTFQWLPFALLFLDRWLSGRRSLKNGVTLGLFLWLQILASWYLAVYTGLIIGVVALFKIASDATRNIQQAISRHLPGFFIILLLVLAAVLPFTLPYLRLLPELQAARPPGLALSLAAAPTDFAAAAPFNRLFGPLTEPLRQRPGFTEENWLFIGLVAPLLAALGLALTRRQNRFLSLSLGLVLLVSLLLTLPGPYTALATLLPPSTVVRVPPRWVIPALFALAGLAALGLAAINRKLGAQAATPVTLALAAILLLEAFSAPIPLAEVTPRTELSPAYRWLAAQPNGIALVELPLHAAPAPEYPEVKRLQASTLGWWGLVNGYSGYTPPRQPQLAAALAGFPDPQSIDALQQLAAQHAASGLQTEPLYLLVHPGEAPLERSQWETRDRWLAERNPALLPAGQFRGDALFEVLPPDSNRFAGEPLALFGDNGQIELLDVSLLVNPPRLALVWRAAAPPTADATVFVHLRAADGFVRSQADGPPVGGAAPVSGWRAGELVQDIHPLPANEDYEQVDHLAIGLYLPASGDRLPAVTPVGDHLPDNALIVPLR